MASIVALTDELYGEEIARARVMKPEEKLLEGPRLFERACRVMADGSGPELDWTYVSRWSVEHGTAGLLEDIRGSLPPT